MNYSRFTILSQNSDINYIHSEGTEIWMLDFLILIFHSIIIMQKKVLLYCIERTSLLVKWPGKNIPSLRAVLTRDMLPTCEYHLNFLWTLCTPHYLRQRKPLLTTHCVFLCSNTRRSLTKGRAKIRLQGLLSCCSPTALLKCQLIENGNYPT